MFDDIGFYGSVVNQTISRISPRLVFNASS
jgi:hypothetical protein